MRSAVFQLFVVTSTIVAATELPQCSGTLKCCSSITAYSDLSQSDRDNYGLDPENNNANVCKEGTPVEEGFDADVCDSVEHVTQCCLAFVPTRPLPEDLTFNCHNVTTH
ncbi:hypothetical protein BDV59DRAFT_204463 [Aspergillus ambiguus]|uniref:uncharacterized protein n=1 Tax=Aspergillus ambiguus TaxID=176160 RepID=UPI003CCE5310